MTPPVRPDGSVIRLRNVRTEIIVAEDSPALTTAINAFLESKGDATYLGFFHVADWEVLILYAD